MSIIETSIKRPVSVFIFAVAAIVFGVIGYRGLGVDLLPDISYPSLTVRTDYEGAAPAEIETLVTRPVENAVGVVNNVKRVVSVSRADRGEVTLEFAWGTNMDFAALDVRERLDVVRLPVDAERPILLRYDPSLDPVLRIAVTADSYDLFALRVLAEEEIRRALERVDGVAAAIVSGGLEEEIQVEVDERRLGSLGIPVQTVVDRLAAENVNLTGGRLREGQTEYLVRTVGELVRAEDLSDIVVSASGGAITRLRDVAVVRRGAKEREIITRLNGKESVEIAVYKEGGGNTVAVSRVVRARLDSLRGEIMRREPTLVLQVITDQARFIQDSVDSVVDSATTGGLLAVLVLFAFLRSVRNTATIAISIPVSIAATLFLMYVFGVSLNVMSLGGLTLGIGMLVDNSIVVLESIQRRREQGAGLVDAARLGASEVAKAVIASTLTTVCVFAPIVFVEGVAGQLFGDQALTVTFSLIVSLIVALTVVPMLASRRFAPEQERAAPADVEPAATSRRVRLVRRSAGLLLLPLDWIAWSLGRTYRFFSWVSGALLSPPLAVFGRVLDGLKAAYLRVIDWALVRPVLVLGTTVVALVLSVFAMRSVGTELVPELVQGELLVDFEARPGTRLEVTDRRLQTLEQLAASVPGVNAVYAVAGASREQGGSAGETRENVAQMTIQVSPPVSRQREDEVMATLRELFDEQNRGRGEGDLIEYRFSRPSYFSFRTPIEVLVRGENLKLLQSSADQIVSRLKEIPGLADVESSTEGGNPELQIQFDRARMASFGLSIAQVGGMVRSKVQGTVASDVQRRDRNIDIRLRVQEQFRDSAADLRALNVAPRGIVPLRLDAIANVREVEGPAEIRRVNGSRVAAITAGLAGRDLGSVSSEIEAALADLQLPPGYDARLGGQREEMSSSYSSLRLAIGLAIFMVYLVMASQFESLLHPFVIMFAVPFSLIGVAAALLFTSTPLSVVALIGAILLAGIVVNNAIVLVDYTNQLRAQGLAKLEALREAGSARLRPILMTTSTTVLGLLPMAMGFGQGSELRAPLAITVIGGLTTSTLLTLVVVPVLYSLFDRGR